MTPTLALFFALPFLASGRLMRRDDSTEGGGDPNSSNNPTGSGLSNWVARPNEAPIQPTKDEFYTTTFTNLTEYRNGQVISQRPISISETYQGINAAYQLLYRSEDAHDSPSVTVASVLVPHSADTNGNIVVFQLPEDAVSLDCSPTYQLFDHAVVPEIQSLLSEGFIVVVPDYEGPRGSFTVGKLAGKLILDSARAALSAPGVRPSNRTANIGLWGYGTAAHATGWAAELASTYAPELSIKGVALGGVIARLQNWISAINNTPSAGSIVASLLGMATEYADMSQALSDTVVPRKRSQFEGAANRCSPLNTIHYFNSNVTSEFFSPGVSIFALPKVNNVYEINNLGKSTPKASVYIYEGEQDTVAPINDVRQLASAYCANGGLVKYREIPGASHFQGRYQYGDVVDFFLNTLSGALPISSCERIRNGGFY